MPHIHGGLQIPWHTLALMIALSVPLGSLGKEDGPQLAARYAQKAVTWSYAALYESFKQPQYTLRRNEIADLSHHHGAWWKPTALFEETF